MKKQSKSEANRRIAQQEYRRTLIQRRMEIDVKITKVEDSIRELKGESHA